MIKVLFSFPSRFNKSGIGLTAWQQVMGLTKQGVHIDLFCASCDCDLDKDVQVIETMVPWGIRIPIKLIGYKAVYLHDITVARHLRKNPNKYNIVHCWPSGGLLTLKTAKELGIKTFTERPNSHTEYACDIVKEECNKLHYVLPKKHSHVINKKKNLREMAEFDIADKLLCPSQFVYDSFINKGFDSSRLALYHYGYDPVRCFPSPTESTNNKTFRALFIGSCEPRKGLHYALQAWLNSKACRNGEFLICGNYVKSYRETLTDYLSHPSIRELGYVDNVQDYFSNCNLLIFPTIEEGSALVTYEARACGCVILVSKAAGAWGEDSEEILLHEPGDIKTITRQIDFLYSNPTELIRVKTNSLNAIKNYTWDKMSEKLMQIYLDCI